MMQPALRRWKINEETNLGVERGGGAYTQKNRRYIVLDKKNRAHLGSCNQSAQNMYSNNRIDRMHGA
jgi:hypothetical protein